MSSADFTPCAEDLLKAIRLAAAADGVARSLFDVAVRGAGLDYSWAHNRLGVLEALGYVEVDRIGRGHPLTIRPVS